MRDKAHPDHKLEWPGGVVPEWARPQGNGKRFGRRGGKGGKAANSKRERLQKVMAQSGYGSRRNIEILIAQGHLTINGQLAKLGDSAGPGDKVKLDGNVINLRYGEQLPRVLIYHKPEGEIVTRDDPENRATVFDKLPKVNGGRWVSVGRLDLNTGGLLLFTTNGDLANKLTHPRFEVEREYAVRILGELTEEQQEKLLKTGVDIDGELCTFDSIEDRGGEGANHWYHVVLREGKNREVRRMVEAVSLVVSRLMRVRFGCVTLPGHVKRGMLREMEEEQVQELLAFAGMNEPVEGAEGEEEEVDDAQENIGNRIDLHREAKAREIDDDIGNKFHARDHQVEAPEPDGNRGTYDPNAAERVPKPGGGRAQGKKPFFNKKRGGGQQQRGSGIERGNQAERGNGIERGNQAERGNQVERGNEAQPGNQARQGQPGQGHGQRKRRKHHSGQQGGNAGQPGNQAQQGQPGQGSAPQGEGQGPKPQGGQPGQPGQGKAGRGRRNRNRNRNRGAQGARGDQQPSPNGNREP